MNSLEMNDYDINDNEIEHNDQNTSDPENLVQIDEIEASDPSNPPRKRSKKDDWNKGECEAAKFFVKNHFEEKIATRKDKFGVSMNENQIKRKWVYEENFVNNRFQRENIKRKRTN